MKFDLTHTFEAPVDAVIAAMFDPALFDHLKTNMTTIRAIEPLDRNEDATSVRRRTRFIPEPLIKKIGPKEVPAGAMAWVEESRFDKAHKRIEFENIADQPQVRKLLVN